MKIDPLHSWNILPTEAAAIQRELASQVDTRCPLTKWELVAGADVSYNRFSSQIYVGVVVVRAADGTVVEARGAVHETKFPYIPGFLSFREAPAVLKVFRELKTAPDVVM